MTSENMEHILTILLCSAVLVNTSTVNWRQQLQKATWEFQLVPRVIDTQITIVTLEAETLIGCSSSCSSLLNVQVVSLYFVQATSMCYCNMAVDTSPETESVPDVYYGTLQTLNKKELTDAHFTRITVWPYQKDCMDLYNADYKDDAVYRIDPKGGAVTDTWCDMANGGWTVIQWRKDGSENFTRTWSDYVNGFGTTTGEYWLGLENIHSLTQNDSHLQIFLEAFPGVTPSSLTANYSSFSVSDGASNYKLHLAGFTGDSCGDSFMYHNGQAFSTYDKDNDVAAHSCAVRHRSGWWFKVCHRANLNGYYFQSGEYSSTATHSRGIHWKLCWDFMHSLKTSVMKIRSS